MDSLSLFISILGSVLTIIFGVLTVRDFVSRRRYPGRLDYIQLNSVNLLNRIAEQFDNVKLTYQNDTIDTNLIYIKGAIVNTGRIDINKHHDTNSILLKLPHECEWLDIKTSKTSDDLIASIRIEEPTKASLTFDILKRNEYVTFESIIKASPDIKREQLAELVTFNHRYENTDKINRQTLSRSVISKYKARIFTIFSILFIMGLAFSFTRYYTSHRGTIMYHDDSQPGLDFRAYINSDNVIELENADDNWAKLRLWPSTDRIITKEQLQSQYTINDYNEDIVDRTFICLVAIEIILIIIMMVMTFVRRYRAKKLLRLIGE